MPKILTFENMGLSGINSDNTPWSLPPEFITEGLNFRVFANALSAAGGHDLWSTCPVSFFPGNVYHSGSPSMSYWIVMGRDAVYAFDGQTWSDISNPAGYGNIGVDQELDWSACQMGNVPILNNPQVYPEYWSPQNVVQPLQVLPWVAGTSTWEDANQQCRIMRSHNNFLFALDLTDNGTEIRDGIGWSHPADANGLPPSWDYTDVNYLAGRTNLGGDSGHIIDGMSLRNQFVVYSENAINILDEDFQSDFVWRRRELSSTVGALSKDSIMEVKGLHFFIAPGDIVMNNGTQIESIMQNRLRKRMVSNMNSAYYKRSFAVKNDSFKEIWFCVPEGSSQYPNIAYCYNWKDQTWSIRELPADTDMVKASYGPVTSPERTWDSWAGTWNSQKGFWSPRTYSPINDTIVGVSNDSSSLYFLDPIDDRTNHKTVVERTNFPLEGQQTVTTITRVYPHITGSQKVMVQVGSHDYPGSPVRWKPPVPFQPDTDRKVDVKTTGELHAWRIYSEGKGSWNLSGITFDYENAGLR